MSGLLFFLVVHACFTALVSFYNNAICLACEDKVADVVSWIFVRLLVLFLLHPSGMSWLNSRMQKVAVNLATSGW